MQKQNLIACFEDTLRFSQEGPLKEQTQLAVASGMVYPVGFTASRLYAVSEPLIRVVEGGAFEVARENIRYGKTAVLNSANPHYPGGGVTRGAMAQEECLCRSSNLYPCLCSDPVMEAFYRYHREKTDYFFSDRVVYHRDVTVFKDESQVPALLPREEWMRLDVITCAAPYLDKRRYVNTAVLGNLFRSRIQNVLEAAIENGVEVLILGAFGCGAFNAPPEVVARAFRAVLEETRYRNAFRRIIFAIQSSVGDDPYRVCPNLAAFQMAFFGASAELEKLRSMGGSRRDADVRLPGGRILAAGAESGSYRSWQAQNPYYGKQFSVLGDSISTLEGFHPRGYPVFYRDANAERLGVREMTDTWWGKVIGFFGGELLVNDSWSGGRVSRIATSGEQFPSGCSDRRTGGLHVGSVMPDVILVMMGINDWGNGIAIEPAGELDVKNADTCFAMAYGLMLRKLRKRYPAAELWCCTLPRSYVSANPRFRFPEKHKGVDIAEYNRSIVNAALANDCRILDLESRRYDTHDGTHPNAAGMDTLAVMAIRQMAGADGAAFVACESGQPNLTEDCADVAKAAEQNQELPVLRLLLRTDGRTVRLTGECVSAGRSGERDLQILNPYVARNQATFVFRDGSWHVRDENAKNGTYLNGSRLEPEREYPLTAGDVISFARREEMVFEP